MPKSYTKLRYCPTAHQICSIKITSLQLQRLPLGCQRREQAGSAAVRQVLGSVRPNSVAHSLLSTSPHDQLYRIALAARKACSTAYYWPRWVEKGTPPTKARFETPSNPARLVSLLRQLHFHGTQVLREWHTSNLQHASCLTLIPWGR
jgi:hypothetical protein